MATLTSFKRVSAEPAASNGPSSGNKRSAKTSGGQDEDATVGQQNPVFVFDEVNVGDGASIGSNQPDDNENDADNTNSNRNQTGTTNNVNNATNTSHQNDEYADARSELAGAELANHSTSEASQKRDQRQNGLPEVAIDMTDSTTPPLEAQWKHQSSDVRTKTSSTTDNNAAPATAKQNNNSSQPSARQQRANQQRQQNQTANSLNPNQDDRDNVSVSMLAIDCVGTGKSPRQPRRSPLMALFRGKPRESVRRTYTDEDQFEIEWANICLEVQRKWYQRFKLSNLSPWAGSSSEPDEEKALAQPISKMILKHVDGRIKSGEITAILGPSGAGKTSLLNSLFGKYRTAIQGSLRVTGAPSKKHLTVCTIPQNDFLIGYLTTEEALWFASRLKNCEDDFNHDRNIERVIELLGLQRCRHTRINKLSGGQYKRVSIAQEMLSSPDILVLDEPTSGLDSLTCYRTVKVLRDLVEASKAHNLVNPMSIVLTIHQPHREVLDLFHSVYVMAVGGQTLYQGPPGEMESAINEFSGVTMPSEGYNPASFMVELASEEYGRKPIEALVAKQRLKFKESTKNKYPYDFSKSATQITQIEPTRGGGVASGVGSTISLYPLDGKGGQTNPSGTDFEEVDLTVAANVVNQIQQVSKDVDSRIMTPRSGKNSDGVFWRHVNLMSKRCFLSNTRDPLLCTIRIGAHIFIPLVVALIYGPKMGVPNGCPFYMPEINLMEYASMGLEEIQEKHDDIRIQFQNVGLHFMVYYAFGLCMLAFTAISFPLIMHVLIKEIRNGWYSLSTFIMGKMIAELPMAIVLPPISVLIIYTMTGQPSSYLEWRYLVQSLLLILIIMIAEAKGLIFGAICMNSMQTAVFAASVSTVPFILLSGFLIRIREVPYVLQHLAKFSYFKHSVEALIITRYGYGMCDCDPSLIPANGIPRIIGIPPQIMSLTDYYIQDYMDSLKNANSTEPVTEINIPGNNRSIETIVSSITTLSPEIATEEVATPAHDRAKRAATGDSTTTTTTEAPDDSPPRQGIFFDKLASLLTRANAFGYSINSCSDVQPFTMKDMLLQDNMLPPIIGYMFLYIVILKLISYFIVEICVKLKL